MADNAFKTGEKAPESGAFKVDRLVNGGSENNDNTTITMEKGSNSRHPLPVMKQFIG
ncbi:YjzC family protein [Oceanobacillus alkalisoli]|uniref:YjzC family protein n=1 Tax=Oceanobacillus alkalisoli TaxID=2925113 RepID=UPI001EF0FC17|nr:YjzC family protein [Oceanobacillus alkalisoli]MCF3942810.1 YjzC family protein [Oceanobacillus alkalisoli]MCG5102470.1 YjzC family protein [Oceanobacillus alkalisoli]